MNVTLVMVASLDGKTTHGDDSHVSSWSSTEDQRLFASRIEKATLIVMGRKTYDAARETMVHRPGRTRVVVTQNPMQYSHHAIPGQLEFTDETPDALVDRLAREGHTEMLLVGGSELNAAFFAAGLVDELHLTIEPVILGSGNPLVAALDGPVSCTLRKIQHLNDRGTVLHFYHIDR